MSKRVWAYTVAVLLLAAVGAIWAGSTGAPPLRSEHAQPAVVAVDGTVSVNADGNLFHAASCKYLRQPARTMPASEAIAKGYAPCTRCMRRALRK
jgi:hypothetical protein